MAIFITGDTHGDFTRFKKDIFYEQAELTKEDCVIITGDFGGIWDGSANERYWLDWLEKKPFTTLFVSGNHENYDLLAEYPVEEWCGGQVQKIRPSTSAAASWNRTIRSLRGNAGDWTPAGRCTG